jgi:collagen type I/II/III/V/XI/XXIV/XXVII alpha
MEFAMSVDFTLFNAQVTGTDGAAGSASGNIDGGDGGNAIDSLPPYSNTDFSLEPSLNRVFPTTIGGNGGRGAGGANSTTTTPAAQGGQGGKGGAAFVTMADDIFGSASNHYAGFVTITASTNEALAGSAGGAGGRGGLGITVTTGINGSNDSVGTDGAGGGAGGIGEVAATDLTGMISYATRDLAIILYAIGGQGGQGGSGGSGGNGSLSAGNGGNGAAGGAGASAEVTFSGAVAFNDLGISVAARVTGGLGGSGGPGGNGGNVGPVGLLPTGFGLNGNGAAGGHGGGASATVSGDTLTAPSVQFDLLVNGAFGGAGGLGGNAGPALGLSGVAGVDGTGSITFTNNVVTVGSGIPGDTVDVGNNLLLLNLRVATTGPAGFFPGVLDGSVGGNLAFSGNTFIGNGTSRLALQLGSTGTATIDTASDTMSIGGSATDNIFSGFNTFTLDTNDTFVTGGGIYNVTFAADPDTLVFTPTSGKVTLSGITSTNFLLDFRGFSGSFDVAALANETDTSTGSTVITLSSTSSITLQGYVGGITSGDVSFEPACYAAGSRILTVRGEVPVEALRAGDMLMTAAGEVGRVIWTGQRRVDCRRHSRPYNVLPVRVQAHAFGPGQPSRDLLLSPDHAVLVDGVLIPVRYLLNGATIAQEEVDTVTYHHVELACHDVILAEGLACETYLDTGNRAAFEGNGPAVALHPDFARAVWQADACAPLVCDGARLGAVRSRLLQRVAQLGFAITAEPDLQVLAEGRAMTLTHADGVYRSHLPANARRVQLISRRFVPAHAMPDSVDHRRLGVAVARVALNGAAIALDDAMLTDGWHAPEGGWRWTDGQGDLVVTGGGVLEIKLAMAARYWLPPDVASGPAMAATRSPA